MDAAASSRAIYRRCVHELGDIFLSLGVQKQRVDDWLDKFTHIYKSIRDPVVIDEVITDTAAIVGSINDKLSPADKQKVVYILTDISDLIDRCKKESLNANRYDPNIRDVIVGTRKEGPRVITIFKDFEACIYYDAANSFAKETSESYLDQCPRWKDQVFRDTDGREADPRRKDLSSILYNNRFSQYARKRTQMLDEKEELVLYYYDGNYTAHRGSLVVNLYCILEDGSNAVLHVKGFRPYIVVGVPDSWLDAAKRDHPDDEAKQTEMLEGLIKFVHEQAESHLKSKHGWDFRFKDFDSMLYPLPEPGKIIFEMKDLLGYTSTDLTKAFKVEVTHPQLIPTLRNMYRLPYGGNDPNGYSIDPFLKPEDFSTEDTDLTPNGVSTIERDDRLFLKKKQAECITQGKRFEKTNYLDDPERKQFYDFWYKPYFGDVPTFTVYEANIDFIMRYMGDNSIMCGWLGVKGSTWKEVDMWHKRTYAPTEIEVSYKNVFSIVDPTDTLPVDPKTSKPLRELTPEEERYKKIFYTKPDTTEMSFDAEMIARFPAFPSPKYCPVIAWGMRIKYAARNETINFIFCLGKPHFDSKEAEDAAKDPETNMWKLDVLSPRGDKSIMYCYFFETDMLRDIAIFTVVIQPQFKVGHNSNGFDYPYFVRRCQVLGIAEGRSFCQLSKYTDASYRKEYIRGKKQITTNADGSFMLDIMYYMKRNNPAWRSFSLNSVAEKVLGSKKVPYGYEQIEPDQYLWEGRMRIIKYLYGDIELPSDVAITAAVYENTFEFCQLQICPFSFTLDKGPQVACWGAIQKFKSSTYAAIVGAIAYLVWFLRKPKPAGKAIEGAEVFDPDRRYFKGPIFLLDFNSLYPSIIMWKNLDYQTLVTNYAIEKYGLIDKVDYWSPPEPTFHLTYTEYHDNPLNAKWMTKEKCEGMVPMLERNLFIRRKRVKNRMEAAELEAKNCEASLERGYKAEYGMTEAEWKKEMQTKLKALKELIKKLNALQNAIKLLMNSIYGFITSITSLCGLVAAGGRVTKTGRDSIWKSRHYVERECTIEKEWPGDAKVVVGDTDSIGVTLFDKNGNQVILDYITAMNIGTYFADTITKDLFNSNLTIAFEKIMTSVIFLAKKHYVGEMLDITFRPSYLIRGVQSKRADSYTFLDKNFYYVMERVFKYHDVENTIDYIAKQFLLLASGKVPLFEIAKGTSLKRDLSECYDVINDKFLPAPGKKLAVTPAMRVARTAYRKSGTEMVAGERIKYIVRKRYHKGRTSKKNLEKTGEAIISIEDAMQHNVTYDVDYYVENFFGNMCKILKATVPGGADELKRRWLQQKGMNYKRVVVDENCDLKKVGLETDTSRCIVCKGKIDNMIIMGRDASHYGITRQLEVTEIESKRPQESIIKVRKVISTKRDHVTKQHITLKYEGLAGKIEKQIERKNYHKICDNCKIEPSIVEQISRKYESDLQEYSMARAKCQQCIAKTFSKTAIEDCKEIECDNLPRRVMAKSALDESWNHLQALRW